MAAPSMVHRSGDTLIVRSVVSGDQLFLDGCADLNAEDTFDDNFLQTDGDDYKFDDDDKDLPHCKIKRNYTCNHCKFFTQNPRHFLTHLRDVHKEKVRIFECPNCIYASKHFQKLLRHMKMVHGSCDGVELPDFSRRRITRPGDSRKRKFGYTDDDYPMNNDDAKIDIEPMPEPILDEKPDASPPVITYKCSMCSFSTRHQGQLTKHERQEHIKTKFFRCGKCNYVTHIKARYTKHVKYHSMPMIKCELCDFRTPYKWNLDRHMKNHGGRGAFRCGACCFTADIKQSLTVHEMNHHVPPVGQAAGLGVGRRRNKVGASDTVAAEEAGDIERRELELLQEMESPQQNFVDVILDQSNVNNNNTLEKLNDSISSKKITIKGDFILPDDIIQHTNGNVYLKTKCKLCNYKTALDSEMINHEKTKHNIDNNTKSKPITPKKIPRPVPNLIPIQGTSVNGTSLLKIPQPRIKNDSSILLTEPQTQMSQKDINEICAKSQNSTLKDFASLFGGEDALKSENMEKPTADLFNGSKTNVDTFLFKKKNASFFDKLKEKLMTTAGETCNLTCSICGYLSSCLSEAATHQKTCGKSDEKYNSLPIMANPSAVSSTRCQHCRHRCKSSADLLTHLQTCLNINNSESEDTTNKVQVKVEISNEPEDEAIVDDPQEPHPMENVVFVWNTLPQRNDVQQQTNDVQQQTKAEDDSLDLSVRTASPVSETSLASVEPSPGPPRKKMKADFNEDKKVFKCPHCSFWASTASRFHVHIVGHLNKKPFECSLCSYRSNWRWDITKHIRLKTARDPNHECARVLMTDETGRRNYSKYNKYLILMKVNETTGDSHTSGRRSKAEENMSQGNVSPSQEAAFPTLPLLHSGGSVTTMKPSLKQGNVSPSQQTLFPTVPNLIPTETLRQGLTTALRPPPPLLKSSDDSKKTLFKCKKCNFRDADRVVVLNHVKGHYKEAGAAATSVIAVPNTGNVNINTEPGENDEASVAQAVRGAAPYRCGHCHQVSNWKHVIQRHCRIKHNGDIRVEMGKIETDASNCSQNLIANASDTMDLLPTVTVSDGTSGKCDKCPYISDSVHNLETHAKKHSPSAESVFKCYFCPYYVTSKDDLLQHLPLHGISNPEEYFQAKSVKEVVKSENSQSKRYQCTACPYVSNSKSQFLYHKQFHRPRGSAFKCGICSYNVSRRHLLHQHLRVHGIVIRPAKHSKGNDKGDDIDEDHDEIEEVQMSLSDHNEGIDIETLKDVPLVWVYRGGNFTKMFKCRFCPHISSIKNMIIEHELMHTSIDESDQEIDEKAQCFNCNFVSNNIEILDIHKKMHSGVYGAIYGFVDLSTPDEEQINSLTSCVTKNLFNINNLDDKNSCAPDTENIVKQPLIQNIKNTDNDKLLCFCMHCPARFLYERELNIHLKFHTICLAFRCKSCSYTARRESDLLAHNTVHTDRYLDKTKLLQAMHSTSLVYRQPKLAVVPDSENDYVLIVAPDDKKIHNPNNDDNDIENVISASKVLNKHYPCEKCPARYFKEVELHYHKSFHGSNYSNKCRYCDYNIDTVEKLNEHEILHFNNIENDASKSVPVSGTELFKSKEIYKNNSVSEKLIMRSNDRFHSLQQADPQFGNLIHGSPEFIYPTYVKKGRVKEKRYKCHKCPSAFEKREQYRVHLSLHGSKQRYNCETCDYSVKYYANYVQHIKKHQVNADAHAARRRSSSNTEDEGHLQDSNDELPSLKAATTTFNKPLTTADKQALIFLENHRNSSGSNKSALDSLKLICCNLCPFTHSRREVIDTHIKKHISVSGKQNQHTCDHCDFSVPQLNHFKDHVKLHFMITNFPETFIKCEQLELSLKCDDNSESIFKDSGKLMIKQEIEFLDSSKDATSQKIIVNTSSGETWTDEK